jgi:hypothetical protein
VALVIAAVSLVAMTFYYPEIALVFLAVLVLGSAYYRVRLGRARELAAASP